MTVRDVDKGWNALVKRVFDMQRPRVAVGIFEADGQKPAGDGMTLIEVAVINEFGGGNVPERSFLRAWFDENIDVARETLAKLLQAVVAGRLTKEQALDQFGLSLQAQVQARIARGVPPPNAPSTIAKKSSSKPLVYKGQLRSSITIAVDMGTGELKVHER